jgi:hypothetical protein
MGDTSTRLKRSGRRTRPSDAEIARMHASPRCGARARTRDWQPCRNPAVKGKRRCRMHGGKNEGGKIGNQNALKHGRYRQAVLRERREIRNFMKWCDGVLTALAHNAK